MHFGVLVIIYLKMKNIVTIGPNVYFCFCGVIGVKNCPECDNYCADVS